MVLVEELDKLISLLEAEIPANPRSPANQGLEKALQRDIAKYFKSLEDAFPFSKLDKIYNRYVTETLGSESAGMLDPLLSAFQGRLKARLASHLATIYFKGSAEMITWGKTKAGVPIAYEGPPMEEAIEWAEKHSAKLVTEIDSETKRRMAKVVSDAIKNKRGIPGLSRDLRSSFEGMTKYRSQLIARTETANALSTASLDRMKDMGVDGKEWITADAQASPECLGNEAEGVIPADKMFSGGVMAPPQHPNCRCALAPAMLKK